MCGRYTLTVQEKELIEEFEAIAFDHFQPRYNIAPTQLAPIVRLAAECGKRQIAMHRWGLIPSWASDPSIGNKMINVRAETAAEKPAFRAVMKRQRCLVPCTGFYEWKVLNPDTKKPIKQPHYIRRRDERLMAFAGLWDRWQSPNGEAIDSFTILTTEPNELMRELHDRMPVIISREAFDLWLDDRVHEHDRLSPFLGPCPVDDLVAFPVSKLVNNPRFDDPACIQAA